MADLDYLKQAADEVMKEEAASAASPEQMTASEPDEVDDIPSFFDSKNKESSPAEDTETDENDVPSTEPSLSGTLKYTADGKEYEATPEEAKQALAMMKGARQAFSERAKLRRQNKELQQLAESGRQYKEYWEEMLQDANNPKDLFKKLTGNSFDDMVNREIQRRQLYASATPDQRQLLDYEDKFQDLESRQARVEQEARAKAQELEEKASKARKDFVSSLLEPAYHQVTERLDEQYSPTEANKLRKSLWRESIDDLKTAISRGLKPSPTLAKKIFERNAQILIRDNKAKIEQGVKQEIQKKSEDAKLKAQVASTQNYTPKKDNYDELLGLDPVKLFERMAKKK